MANQVTNYKCPACTGPLRFDSATGKLQCDFCGSSYEVAEVEKLYAEKDAQAAGAFRQAEEQAAADGEWASASGSDWGADAEKLRVYSCPSCGAELICDETTSATSCPYCGNNTIVPGQFSGALKPDYVLPFKLDKAAAVAALKKHYGGKKLLPKAFSNENHIEEVKGVYVPFWLYDGSAEVDVRCHGTKVSGYSTARENVTVTNHYDVRRAGTVRFERVPVDASSKMPDDHMDAIEPFDYTQMQPFSTAYLPGYLADKYDVTVDDSRARADRRSRETLENALRETVTGYGTCVTDRTDIRLHRGKVLPSYPECALAGDAELREEILDERAREFAFEEIRWFDIVRWKRADIFRQTLYGIRVTILDGTDSSNFRFNFSEPIPETDRAWKNSFDPKWYLSAFPSNEVNKGYGLTQNAGW